eukprot:1116548-Pelagomonas_calceolata.AAC.3
MNNSSIPGLELVSNLNKSHNSDMTCYAYKLVRSPNDSYKGSGCIACNAGQTPLKEGFCKCMLAIFCWIEVL